MLLSRLIQYFILVWWLSLSFLFIVLKQNGNCLYSSVSILFSGNNSLSSHLRYLTCKELFLNLEFYYKHPLLSQAYNENKDLYTSYDNMFNFTVSTISFYTNARGVMFVREESKLNVKDNTSSPIYVFLSYQLSFNAQ